MKRVFGVILAGAVLSFGTTVLAQTRIDVEKNAIEIHVNGEDTEVDNFLYEETAYVSIRDFIEIFHIPIEFDESSKTANIITKIPDTEEKTAQKKQLKNLMIAAKWYSEMAEQLQQIQFDCMWLNSLEGQIGKENNTDSKIKLSALQKQEQAEIFKEIALGRREYIEENPTAIELENYNEKLIYWCDTFIELSKQIQEDKKKADKNFYAKCSAIAQEELYPIIIACRANYNSCFETLLNYINVTLE